MIEAAIRSACQSIAGSEAAANAVLALGDAVRHGEVSVGSISRIDYSDLDAGSGSVEGEPESTESAAVELAESEESAKTKEAFLLAVSSFESSLSRCGVGKSKQSNSILFDSVLDLRLTMGGVRAVNAILGASSTDCDALVSSLHKLRVLEEEMVESNIRLVAFVAKKYAFKGCPRMELIQEGILGLIRAIEKFDFARGTKFSTYAIWWIRQSITRYLADKTRTIRVPVHMVEKINKLDAVARAAGAESAAELSIEYLADRSGLTIPEVRKALSVVGEPLSFSDSDEVLRQVEGISDPDQTPEESAVQADLARSVRRCLAELSEREAAVIAHRFGLKDGNEWTLEEVGAVFDVTRERIRQIEASALKKLRHPNRRALLGRAINDLDEAED